MRSIRILAIFAAAAAVILAASCAKPPEDKIRKTRAALVNLRDVVKAQRWAPEEISSAAAAVEVAEKELFRQRERFAFRRDYDRTTELFESAMADVEMARQAAAAAKKAAEKEAREALDAATAAVGHAQAALTIAPVSRDSRGAFSRLDTDLERAEGRIQEVRNLIVAEEYKEATARAEEILEQVSSLLRAVSRSGRR